MLKLLDLQLQLQTPIEPMLLGLKFLKNWEGSRGGASNDLTFALTCARAGLGEHLTIYTSCNQSRALTHSISITR